MLRNNAISLVTLQAFLTDVGQAGLVLLVVFFFLSGRFQSDTIGAGKQQQGQNGLAFLSNENYLQPSLWSNEFSLAFFHTKVSKTSKKMAFDLLKESPAFKNFIYSSEHN